MVYTDYFVRGTQPTTVCPLHDSPSLLDRLAGAFGKDSGHAPIPADEAGLPAPAPSSTSGNASSAAVGSDKPHEAGADERAGEEPKKKKGFWSRVFGDKKSDDEKKQDEDRRKAEEERKKQEDKRKRDDKKPEGIQ